MSPCARWSLPFFISPACIFHSESPPACSFSRLGRRICHRVPAGRCRCSPHRRARLAAWGVEYVSVCPLALAVLRLAGVHFFIAIPRRHARLAVGDGEYATVCPLVAAVLHLAAWGLEYAAVCPLALAVLRLTGVHFSFHFPAVMVVSTVPAGNMSPRARWSLPFFILPACIFIANPRRRDRFAVGDGKYATVCPLALAVLHLTGVHFSFHFPAVMVVSTVPAGNMSPCARRPLPLLTSPACKKRGCREIDSSTQRQV